MKDAQAVRAAFVSARAGDPHDRPLVSVVIPTYNRTARLQRLLDAIARSDVPEGGMEVIVVDDGSTDATAEVAVAAANVRYIAQPNRGPAAAREHGWRLSVGQSIVFFDDDAVPEPDAIRLLVAGLDTADAVGANIRPRDATSPIARYMHADGMLRHRVVDGEVLWVTAAATAFRRDALERVGGFDLSFRPSGEDVDLGSRLLAAGCVLRVEPRAVVTIDCPTHFWPLARTLYLYGRAFRMLASRHDSFRKERIGSALLRLSLREWRDMYHSYRLEASRPRSIAFLLLHAVVVIPYGVGVIVGQHASKDRIGYSSLPADGRSVELVGSPQLLHPKVDPAEQTLAS